MEIPSHQEIKLECVWYFHWVLGLVTLYSWFCDVLFESPSWSLIIFIMKDEENQNDDDELQS